MASPYKYYITHNSEAHCRAVASWACSSLRCCSCSLACQLVEGQVANHYISKHAWDCWRSSSTSLDRFSLHHSATNVNNRLDLQNSSQHMFHIFYMFVLSCRGYSVPSILGFRVTLKANRRHLFKISGSNCSADEQKRTSQAA